MGKRRTRRSRTKRKSTTERGIKRGRVGSWKKVRKITADRKVEDLCKGPIWALMGQRARVERQKVKSVDCEKMCEICLYKNTGNSPEFGKSVQFRVHMRQLVMPQLFHLKYPN